MSKSRSWRQGLLLQRAESWKTSKSFFEVADFFSFFLVILFITFFNLFSNPILFAAIAGLQLVCFVGARIYGTIGLWGNENIPNKRSQYNPETDEYAEKMPTWERRLYLAANIVTGLLIATALTFAIMLNSVAPLAWPGLLQTGFVAVGGSIAYLFAATSLIFMGLGLVRIWDRYQQKQQGIVEAKADSDAGSSKPDLAAVTSEGNWKIARATFQFLLTSIIGVDLVLYFIPAIHTLAVTVPLVASLALITMFKHLSKSFFDSKLVTKNPSAFDMKGVLSPATTEKPAQPGVYHAKARLPDEYRSDYDSDEILSSSPSSV